MFKKYYTYNIISGSTGELQGSGIAECQFWVSPSAVFARVTENLSTPEYISRQINFRRIK